MFRGSLVIKINDIQFSLVHKSREQYADAWMGLKSLGTSYTCENEQAEWGWFEGDQKIGDLAWAPSDLNCFWPSSFDVMLCGGMAEDSGSYYFTIAFDCIDQRFMHYICEFY